MDDLYKLIGCGILAILGLYLLLSVLPYLVVGLAVLGVWHIYISNKTK